MTRKKFNYLLGLLLLVSAGVSAQITMVRHWEDSSYIPNRRLPQSAQFSNHAYIYPAKPRSMWELSVHGGVSTLLGSVSNLGFNAGVGARFALGHTLSFRADYTASQITGIASTLTTSAAETPSPWKDLYGTGKTYVANFRAFTHQLSLDFIPTIGNISFYKHQTNAILYGVLGYNLVLADVNVDAKNASGAAYDFSTISTTASASDIRSKAKSIIDGKYESNAPFRSTDTRINDNQLLMHAIRLGTGVAFRISPRFNIGIEQDFDIPFAGSKSLDGLATSGNKVFSHSTVRLNFNIGKSSKRVEPLWWVNPLNYIYSELNEPKHMKLPKPVLDDSDGDGITDQFDLEPNTPKGASVDTHGVSRDTDGDGVPDYKDKELITPTKCMPVDADGVGNCPCDPKCGTAAPQGCNIGSLPSITFEAGSAVLSVNAKAMLANVAEKMRANPECNIDVVGFDKKEQSSKQVEAVANYLSEQLGIQASRIGNVYKNQMAKNTVDIQVRP